MRLRAYDTRGRHLLKCLQRVRELAGGDNSDAHIASWCAKGEMLIAKVAEVVHRERDPWSIDDAEIGRWLADGSVLERDEL